MLLHASEIDTWMFWHVNISSSAKDYNSIVLIGCASQCIRYSLAEIIGVSGIWLVVKLVHAKIQAS